MSNASCKRIKRSFQIIDRFNKLKKQFFTETKCTQIAFSWHILTGLSESPLLKQEDVHFRESDSYSILSDIFFNLRNLIMHYFILFPFYSICLHLLMIIYTGCSRYLKNLVDTSIIIIIKNKNLNLLAEK